MTTIFPSQQPATLVAFQDGENVTQIVGASNPLPTGPGNAGSASPSMLPFANPTTSLAFIDADGNTVLVSSGNPLPTGGGGGVAVLVKLGEVILSAPAATIDFPGIPQGFRNLKLSGSVRTTGASTRDDCQMNFNGDFGANYTRNLNALSNANSGFTWDATRPNVPTIWAPAGNAGAGFFGTFETTVFDYSQTDRKKAITGTSNSVANIGDDYLATLQGMWFETAAITEITLRPGSQTTFVAGSRIALYGEL